MASWERPADVGELRALLGNLPDGTVVLPTGAPPPPAVDPAPVPGATDDRAPGIPDLARASDGHASRLVVSTTALSGIRELTPDELILTVGAGARLDALREQLTEAGTWLALGPDAAARSAGGAVASGVPGPWDAAYGDLARQVLACRVVTLAGTEVRWGRAVMKNVAGYDLRRLMCGSWGRLGVLTEVTFRLWPAAPATARCRLTAEEGTLALAGRMIEEGADAGFRPDAVVWSLTPEGFGDVARSPEEEPSERGTRDPVAGTAVAGATAATLEVWFRGADGSVRSRVAALREWAERAGAEAGEEEREEGATDAFLGAGERAPDRSVISIRTGRRGFVEAGRRLADVLGAELEALEGYPLRGTLRCAYRNRTEASASELQADAPLARVLAATDACVRVERGRAAELAAVDERRSAAVRAAEERIVSALEGGARHWLSAYL